MQSSYQTRTPFTPNSVGGYYSSQTNKPLLSGFNKAPQSQPEPYSMNMGMDFTNTQQQVGTMLEPASAYLAEKTQPLRQEMGELGQAGQQAYNGASTLGKFQGIASAAEGVFNAYNSYKTNKLAKEQMKFSKMEADRNYQAQKGLTNSQLADRQAARVARNPNQHASVTDYMNRYGVK